MRLLFLIPLTTAAISGYVFQNTAQEMAYLTGTITIVSLLVSLVLAPWQLQLVIMVLLLISASWLWRELRESEDSDETSHSQDNNPISATTVTENKNSKRYRGLSYHSSPVISNLSQEQTSGTYRGAPVQVRKTAQPLDTNRKSKLRYRGASFPSPSPQENQEEPKPDN